MGIKGIIAANSNLKLLPRRCSQIHGFLYAQMFAEWANVTSVKKYSFGTFSEWECFERLAATVL